MDICEISYYNPQTFSPERFARDLQALIEREQQKQNKEKVVYLCIGSDRSTGDSLGPLTGYLLGKNEKLQTTVIGTLAQPVHAINLEEAITQIETDYRDCIVIAIDASIGKKEHVGYITLGCGSIKPGLGVKKDLAAVGDIFITGIVGAANVLEPLILQNTRLSMVMELADCICKGIYTVETFS